jgi:glycosyltransferase involved in cell wall biosynthesis
MNTPLRISFVAPFGLGQKTTVWARTLPLARELVRHGWQVNILIPPWDTPSDASKCWVDQGVELINVALTGGVVGTVARLLRLIDQQQPQIVHIIKPRAHAGLVHWWLWQRRRARPSSVRSLRSPVFPFPSPLSPLHSPLLLLDIDDWEQAWTPINRYPWPLARFLAWQEEWGIRHADGITAASRWLEERANHYAPKTPILYLPNGVDLPEEVLPSTAAASAPRLLFFTRFVEVEPEWLALFWQTFHAQQPTARLLVAGEPFQPSHAAHFRAAMQHIPATAADQVEWLGYVPTSQLPALYATIHCAIFPARPIPLLQAKCSVKLATTLLYGAPVVASAVGEQAVYGAEGAARLVDPAATPAEFAAAVLTLLREPTHQANMVHCAHQRLAQLYQWSGLGKQLITFYQQVMG